MSDIFMFLGLGLIGYLIFRVMTNKPIIPLSKKKKKTENKKASIQTRELEGDWKNIIGVKQIVGDNLIELEQRGDIRTFVGAVKTEPINYQLRSIIEQEDTDRAYERLLAQLSLGPGREVKLGIHVQSRPIELVDQMQQYYDAFPSLQPIAQRYAESMFFPFMEHWQKNTDEYNFARYFFIILEYPPKLIEDLDDDLIYSKATNEYYRLGSTIVGGYGRMGGVAKLASIEDLLESQYFATHKQSGTVKGFRSILANPGRLGNIVTSDYSRPANRFVDEDLEEQAEEIKDDEKSA
ncbi:MULTISPECIES: hypothetical protein [unclassified Paenibacillus]|uniref:hypothetical protein n=1 Tax=unclassified Paenibacillus TaxID=185978 RepID=UPI002786FFB3|nr:MULTISPECIES: hypothetical protein [unclassified Paenibacillus]MDQ0896343.1 hypothetical protein [Paenibacillus sp. V4I7]MDQ0914114.1 hypothetical protein [Paenibacillus sp. V4I5]